MAGIIGDEMNNKLMTIPDSPIGSLDIYFDHDQYSVVVAAPGGWMFAKRHTGDDGAQLDFGYVRVEDANRKHIPTPDRGLAELL
jgi:hypothetical protein